MNKVFCEKKRKAIHPITADMRLHSPVIAVVISPIFATQTSHIGVH